MKWIKAFYWQVRWPVIWIYPDVEGHPPGFPELFTTPRSPFRRRFWDEVALTVDRLRRKLDDGN